MNGYNLIRDWYNYKFENPSRVKAIHSDFYCYLIDRWNRLGQKHEFGLPTSVTMEALGIGSYNTYKKTLQDLIDFGFIKLVTESKNQHKSKVIALSKNDKASNKALDEASTKAPDESPDTITKQKNKETNEQTISPTKVDAFELIDFEKLVSFINLTFGRSFQVINKKVKNSYNARIKEGYSKDQITDAINNCKANDYHREKNYQYCTPEFFSRAETLDKYSNVTKQDKIVYAFHPIIFD
jgi:uncharacterized phage protein (TIGR02220 family)